MARHDVTHACGHVVAHNIVGPERDRPGQAAWLATRVCETCYAAQQAEARAAASAAAAESAAELGLPPLDGTPKQVAWGERIRGKHMAELQAMQASRAARGEPPEPLAELDAAASVMVRQVAAKWWIDRAEGQTLAQVLEGISGRRLEARKTDADALDGMRGVLRAWTQRRAAAQL